MGVAVGIKNTTLVGVAGLGVNGWLASLSLGSGVRKCVFLERGRGMRGLNGRVGGDGGFWRCCGIWGRKTLVVGVGNMVIVG